MAHERADCCSVFVLILEELLEPLGANFSHGGCHGIGQTDSKPTVIIDQHRQLAGGVLPVDGGRDFGFCLHVLFMGFRPSGPHQVRKLPHDPFGPASVGPFILTTPGAITCRRLVRGRTIVLACFGRARPPELVLARLARRCIVSAYGPVVSSPGAAACIWVGLRTGPPSALSRSSTGPWPVSPDTQNLTQALV